MRIRDNLKITKQALKGNFLILLVSFWIIGMIESIPSSIITVFNNASLLFKIGKVGDISLVSIIGIFIGMMLIYALSAIILTGYTKMYHETVRGNSANIGDIFAYFKYGFKVIGLYIVITLFTMLWSLLFIIPGIIKGFSYSMAVHILIDNPEKSIMQCIEESKAMMKGNKGRYFLLNLVYSMFFIIICILPFVLFIYGLIIDSIALMLLSIPCLLIMFVFMYIIMVYYYQSLSVFYMELSGQINVVYTENE